MATIDRKAVLDDAQRARAASEIPGWEVHTDRLSRSFEFADFVEAFGFMSRVALVAEQLNHHPEWSNVWNRVEIEITNHDAGGVTEVDVEFCRRVDALIG
jgi:4a-hydroxytetrahydrobiopterin dehydratase